MLSVAKEFQTLCSSVSSPIGSLPCAKQLFLSQFVSLESPETRKLESEGFCSAYVLKLQKSEMSQ